MDRSWGMPNTTYIVTGARLPLSYQVIYRPHTEVRNLLLLMAGPRFMNLLVESNGNLT
jgi:hypothetical protein